MARSAYATPAELGPRVWAADFLWNEGMPAFPVHARINPYAKLPHLKWQPSDWDPGLRFWSLPFDPHLTEWLQDVDLSAWSTQAAREFAAQHALWQHHHEHIGDQARALVEQAGWLTPESLDWLPRGAPTSGTPSSTTGKSLPALDAKDAWPHINTELEELVDLMQDSRSAYLGEAWAQADDIPGAFIALMGLDLASKPWTFQLMRCGLSIGNVAYMYFKSRFARVRPSVLCPGLLPPFGPPRHPAFPSGHAFLGHFVAVSLLQIPEIAARFGEGIRADGSGSGGKPPHDWYLKPATGAPSAASTPALQAPGPLLWLADRLARNRERIGVHYRSDSEAGRSLAGGIHRAIMATIEPPKGDADDPQPSTLIDLPAFRQVLARARAEWL